MSTLKNRRQRIDALARLFQSWDPPAYPSMQMAREKATMLVWCTDKRLRKKASMPDEVRTRDGEDEPIGVM